MHDRTKATTTVKPLLNIIEQRFDLRLEPSSSDHLLMVQEHYQDKCGMLRHKFGESVYSNDEYAKCFMIAEASRLMLCEIQPRPKKKKKNRD